MCVCASHLGISIGSFRERNCTYLNHHCPTISTLIGTTKRGRTKKRPVRSKVGSSNCSADEDVEWKKAKARKELYLQSRTGTVFDFLDELEPHLTKHIPHRSTLSRQKEASVVFERERRPGCASLDIDFAENLDIEEAKQVQSEHWSTNQCTLFMMVLQFLDVDEWNKEEGTLGVSAQVTVRGELAGKSRAPGSFWAKVTTTPHRNGAGEEIYTVEVIILRSRYNLLIHIPLLTCSLLVSVKDASGTLHEVPRSDLRHRVFTKQAHAGVTGDKKHDRYLILLRCLLVLFCHDRNLISHCAFHSYSMRFFVAKAIKQLKEKTGENGDSIWDSQLLTALYLHSDNAAQHFKSSKSLHWLSKQIVDMGLKSVVWDFGPPGHGKVRKHRAIPLLSSSSLYPAFMPRV